MIYSSQRLVMKCKGYRFRFTSSGGSGKGRHSSAMHVLNRLLVGIVVLNYFATSVINTVISEEVTGGNDLADEDGPDKGLTYVWGDALIDTEALGPDGQPYPWEMASTIARKQRIPRSLFENEKPPPLISPEKIQKVLLGALEGKAYWEDGVTESVLMKTSRRGRQGRSSLSTELPRQDGEGGCVPSRLCPTTYNTTAPMYGISLTSGQPVTIVQKFPDLLQQVVYQVCKTEDCDVIQGKCVQTYLPYLFLVIPLGPVTLTGQDYVLVESGCSCKPKYAKIQDDPPPLPFIQPFNSTKPRANKRF